MQMFIHLLALPTNRVMVRIITVSMSELPSIMNARVLSFSSIKALLNHKVTVGPYYESCQNWLWWIVETQIVYQTKTVYAARTISAREYTI